MLKAPKYGNNNDYADKYAVWFVNKQEEIFSVYRTHDGGRIYTLIASNVANIPAGQEIAATPDGRGKGEPVSDAASPMHGMDTHGPTAAALSLAKPDYTLAAGGTVVNQKYSPEMFREPEKTQKAGRDDPNLFRNGRTRGTDQQRFARRFKGCYGSPRKL